MQGKGKEGPSWASEMTDPVSRMPPVIKDVKGLFQIEDNAKAVDVAASGWVTPTAICYTAETCL